jgi:hypothetical protein
MNLYESEVKTFFDLDSPETDEIEKNVKKLSD